MKKGSMLEYAIFTVLTTLTLGHLFLFVDPVAHSQGIVFWGFIVWLASEFTFPVMGFLLLLFVALLLIRHAEQLDYLFPTLFLGLNFLTLAINYYKWDYYSFS